MRAKKGTLVVMISAVMVLTLCLAWSVSNAYNPPPGDSHYQGPAMVGQFTFTPGDEKCGELIDEVWVPTMYFSFVGQCGGTQFEVLDECHPTIEFHMVTEEELEGFLFGFDGWVPGDCLPRGVTPDGFTFIQVKSYEDLGTEKVADVIMLWVVPK